MLQPLKKGANLNYNFFDTCLDSVFILDRDLNVLYCNEAGALLLDTTVPRILRKKDFQKVIQFDGDFEIFNSIEDVTDPTQYRELNFTSFSGKSGKVQITFQPSPFSKEEWIAYLRDVTLEETLQKKYRAELNQKEDVIEDLKKAQEELEKYSQNLEQMVEERTAKIRELNQILQAMLNSLGQGFLVFDSDGHCLPIYSKACETLLEVNPSGKNIWDVMKLPEKEIEGFKKWSMTIFAEMLPFEDLAPLGPQTFPHSEGKHIHLEYFPLKSKEDSLQGIVLVASDQTAEVKAREDAERERGHAKMIVQMTKNRRHFKTFVKDSKSVFTEIDQELETCKSGKETDIELLFRLIHTLKGGASSFSIQNLVALSHDLESKLAQAQRGHSDAPSLCELESDFNTVSQCFSDFLQEYQDLLGGSLLQEHRVLEIPLEKIHHLVQELQKESISESLKKSLCELTQEPILEHFSFYETVTQETASNLSKSVAPVDFKNGELLITPEPYTELFATFVHAFRNSVDHGIEPPDIRQHFGKPIEGQIEVQFERQEEKNKKWLLIKVSDDGGGIDPEIIRQKLAESDPSASNKSDHEIIQHIFDSQLSTRDVVSETSGRGVGMDAIKIAAQKLSGQVWVESTLGQGTQLYVKVPYIENHQVETLSKKTAA